MRSVTARGILNKYLVFRNMYAKQPKTQYKCIYELPSGVTYIAVGPTQIQAARNCSRFIKKCQKKNQEVI